MESTIDKSESSIPVHKECVMVTLDLEIISVRDTCCC